MCNALGILGCGNHYIIFIVLFQVFIDIQIENCTWFEDIVCKGDRCESWDSI